MKATVKCSECGSEITNLNMSWSNKHLLITLLILPVAFLPMLFIFKDRFAEKPDFRQELSITITKVAYDQGELTMHGTIENAGEHTWEGISAEVEFYDEQDTFVDEATHYLQLSIVPGTTERFKMTMPSERDLSAYDREAKISEARTDLY